MTWSLTASGSTPPGAEPNEDKRKAAEQALFDDLQAVLSKPEHGATASEFHGNYVHGNPHARPEDSTHTREHTGEPA